VLLIQRSKRLADADRLEDEAFRRETSGRDGEETNLAEMPAVKAVTPTDS